MKPSTETDVKVSVVTVCLNSQDTIEQAINSVLSQSYENIEYIIVDGGSIDGTLDIIEKYRCSIAKVISEQDNGLYDAMNKGIDLASGELIGFLNSDDWYETNAIEMMVTGHREAGYPDVVYGNICVHDLEGNSFLKRPYGFRFFPYAISIYQPASLTKKSSLINYYFDIQYKIAADFDLWRKLKVNGNTFFYFDKVITHFRLGGQSTRNGLTGFFEEEKSIFRNHGIFKGTGICFIHGIMKFLDFFF